MHYQFGNFPDLTADQIEQNERCQARAYGMTRMDGWLVCSGRKIVSEILPSLDEARALASQCVNKGMPGVSVYHVGGPYESAGR